MQKTNKMRSKKTTVNSLSVMREKVSIICKKSFF
jgi:hypothetical protein